MTFLVWEESAVLGQSTVPSFIKSAWKLTLKPFEFKAVWKFVVKKVFQSSLMPMMTVQN